MRLFISYRRDDSAAHVRALAEALEDATVKDEASELFVDVDHIPLGSNFVKDTTAAIRGSDVMLAVVGRHWLGSNARRLDDANDPVRIELRTAFETGTPVVVVLVDGGCQPSSRLPADIWPLASAEVIELRDDRFDEDVDRLTTTLGRFERRSPRPPAPATLRLLNDGTGWLASGDRHDVHVDGRKIGVICSGTPMDFVLPAGQHTVTLKRGLRSSEGLTVALERGRRTTIGYEIGVIRIVLRAKD
jgi:TIR domain